MNTLHDVGVARHIGAYSDAVQVDGAARWLITSGTPGLAPQGELPEDFETQATLAWQHVLRMLADAGMDVHHIVKVTQVLVRRADLEAYRPIRSRFLGQHRPAFMLSFVSGLVWPKMLIELEVTAARPAQG